MKQHKRIKVLYVTHEPNLTGASQSLLDLLDHIDKTKIEPKVLLRNRGPIIDHLERLGIEYDIVPYVLSIKSKYKYRPDFLKRIGEKLSIRRLKKYLKWNEYDLIHNNTLLVSCAMKASLDSSIPYICHIRELMHDCHGMRFVDENEVRDLVNKAAYTVFISNAVQNRFSKWVLTERFCTLHDGVDVSYYYEQHKSIFENSKIEIMLAGRISEGKGQLEAIQAVEILANKYPIHLTIIGSNGDDRYAESCYEYVKNNLLSNYVTFVGFTNDLRPFWRASDIALCCSKEEALGRVIIEGMLAGCLVVSSDCESALELIENGVTGFTYKHGNITSLAEVIEQAKSKIDDSQSIARNGQIFAKESFNPIVYAETICNLYHAIIETE